MFLVDIAQDIRRIALKALLTSRASAISDKAFKSSMGFDGEHLTASNATRDRR
jgi:hypothetical protein